MEPPEQPSEIRRLLEAIQRQLAEMAPALGGALGGTGIALDD